MSIPQPDSVHLPKPVYGGVVHGVMWCIRGGLRLAGVMAWLRKLFGRREHGGNAETLPDGSRRHQTVN
jgi:hypothetical protein